MRLGYLQVSLTLINVLFLQFHLYLPMRVVRVRGDSKLCVGCRLCMLACSTAVFGVINPRKSAVEIVERRPETEGFSIVVCSQCGLCAEKCPEKAIAVVNRAYVIDVERCVKCWLCVEVCPVNAIWRRPGVDYPVKCISCGACVEICPRGALSLEESEVGVA